MMSGRVMTMLGSFWLALGSMAAGEVEWPGWRGGDRDGLVTGVDVTAWAERFEEVWGVDVGTGYGTPLVVGERVFVHARQGDEEVLWCLGLETGEVKWR
ncbi:MAG: hypothetical protein P8J87_18675, partial [Verrucomicrobiales bacterium]|nr:hypothetical protein [Verrucomicrobiales bacterium]